MFIGHFAPAVFDAFVASSSLVEGRGRDKMVSERRLQQWASMGQEGAVTEGRITFSDHSLTAANFKNCLSVDSSRKA